MCLCVSVYIDRRRTIYSHVFKLAFAYFITFRTHTLCHCAFEKVGVVVFTYSHSLNSSLSRCVNGVSVQFNPYLTNGLSHRYHWEGPLSCLGASREIFIYFLSNFFIKILIANRLAPDRAPQNVCLGPKKGHQD